MSEILEQLEVNQTFFVQFGLFTVFFFILSFIYLTPFQKLIEKRNQKLKSDLDSASELLKTVETKLQEYQLSLNQTRAEAKKNHDDAVASAKAREESALQKHREELKKEYLKAVEQFTADKAKVEAELKSQISGMADSVVQKIVAGK